MDILIVKDYSEAVQKACDLYNKECDTLGCKTPEKERVTKRHSPPMVNADTKAVAVIVTDTKLCDVADITKVTAVAKTDEAKWSVAWNEHEAGRY
jgi:hypothetical protein